MSGQRNASINTIKSYRDAFKLFLTFCKEEKDIVPERLTLSKISPQIIKEYYDWLEKSRTARDNYLEDKIPKEEALNIICIE